MVYLQPGDVNRRPCIISPYHYRMDWLLWFAAFQNYQRQPWLAHLMMKLLRGDEAAFAFFVHNPFPDPAEPPVQLRMQHYRYRFASGNPTNHTTPTHAKAQASGDVGTWWYRELVGPYMPAVNRRHRGLREFMRAHGWG